MTTHGVDIEASVRPRRFSDYRWWTWGTMLLCLLVFILVIWLHYQYRQELRHAAANLGNIRQALIELEQGFLHTSLANDAGSPFDREQGVALLQQSVSSFERALANLEFTDVTAAATFRKNVNKFRSSLDEWRKAKAPASKQAVSLRIAFSALEREASLLDAASQRQLRELSTRLDHRFTLALSIAAVLLATLGITVFRVTEARNRAVAGLQASEERLKFAMEGANDAIWDVDLNTNAIFLSPRGYEMFGYRETEFLTDVTSWRQRVHPDDLPATTKALNDHLSGRSTLFRIEQRLKTKSGKYLWVLTRGKISKRDEKGRALRMTGTHTDITERKRAEALLHESRERLQLFIEYAPASLAMFDSEMRYIAVSNRWRSDYKLGDRDLLGQSHYDIFPEIPDRWKQAHRRGLNGEVVQADGDPFERADGSIQLLRWEIHPWWTSEKQVGGIVIFTEDITERKQSENERLKLQEQLNQVQKLESVGRLAGGVAHDFNNMLGIIIGHAEMILADMDPRDPLFDKLHEIRKAAEHSAGLTRQLLAFARRQTIVPKILDVNEVVEGILKMLRRLIGEDITLIWRPGAGLVQVKMDPSQVDQILANLCVNARDAIAGVGKITIQTEIAAVDEGYRVHNPDAAPGDYVKLTITDSGSGMDKETQSRIFEPFFTTKGVGLGTGLGLSTVYGIVKQNKGFINVYSEPGKGTSFAIYLPRDTSKTLQGQAGIKQIAVGGTETILLVEDDASLLNLGKTILEALGYTVLTASIPSEALRLAEAHTGGIQMLITDVVMPEMNGKELSGRLLSVHPNLKCLFMSGYTADIITHQGVVEKGVDFIQKPFSIYDFSSKIREILNNADHTG